MSFRSVSSRPKAGHLARAQQSLKLFDFQLSMFSAKMIRPLVDYSDNDEDVEAGEENVNNSNIVEEEKCGAGKGIEKFITVKHTSLINECQFLRLLFAPGIPFRCFFTDDSWPKQQWQAGHGGRYYRPIIDHL